jgi:hypothetical protein
MPVKPIYNALPQYAFQIDMYWHLLSGNPNVVPVLEQNIDKLDWEEIASNKNAGHLLAKKIQETFNVIDNVLCDQVYNTIKIKKKKNKSQKQTLLENKPLFGSNKGVTRMMSRIWFNPGAVCIFEKWCEVNTLPSFWRGFGFITDGIHWWSICANRGAIRIIEKNMSRVNWQYLSENTAAIHILEQNLDKVDWYNLSANPAAIHILERNLDKVHWGQLSTNINAIHLLERNIRFIDWKYLSANPSAIRLLEQNINKIDWEMLSINPAAIRLIERNLDKIDWDALAWNPNALHILKRHKKLTIESLARHPDALQLLFKMDFGRMKRENAAFAEELAGYVFSSQRLNRLAEALGMELIDYVDFFE